MNEAARRLTSGDCNLTVLYADLGYTSPTSFRRVQEVLRHDAERNARSTRGSRKRKIQE